jgi:hypothetical protein
VGKGNALVLILFVTALVATGLSQDVTIPESGLAAAIRSALSKTAGPLTVDDLLRLTTLDASSSEVRSVDGLSEARNLVTLDLSDNQLASLTVPPELTNLTSLALSLNQLTNLILAGGMRSLEELDVDNNHLTELTLPADLTNLTELLLYGNELSSLTVPGSLIRLSILDAGENVLTNLTLAEGLTNLMTLNLSGNELSSVSLPAGSSDLGAVFLDNNPLQSLILPENLAKGLGDYIELLESAGVLVYTYGAVVRLVLRERNLDQGFEGTLTGPLGAYRVFGSGDLASWVTVGIVTNQLGSVVFDDPYATNFLHKFYRAETAH